MTRSNAREVAVHMIYELGFGSRSAEELLEHEMTRERFAQLGDCLLYTSDAADE